MQCPPLERLSPTPIVADVAFLIACLLFVIALVRQELRWRRSNFYWVLGFYATACVLSRIAVATPEVHPDSLLIEAYLLAAAILTFNLVQSEAVLKLVAEGWMVGTAVTALAAIVGVFLFYAGAKPETNVLLSSYGTLVPGDYPRVRGLFLNMNMCCNYLSIGFVLLLGMLSVGWIGKRWALLLGAAVVIASIFTFSLGLGGLALGIGVWMSTRYHERGRPIASRFAWLAGAAVAVAFLGAMLVSPPSLFAQDGKLQLRISRWNPSGRVLCWRDAWNTVWQNKWFGKGPGMPVAGVHLLTASGEQQFLTDAHNTFLSVTAHEGLLGLAAFCILLIFVFRKPKFRTKGRSEVVMHTAVWIGLMQALLYQGLGGSWEHTRHIWVLIGLVAALQPNPNWETGDTLPI